MDQTPSVLYPPLFFFFNFIAVDRVWVYFIAVKLNVDCDPMGYFKNGEELSYNFKWTFAIHLNVLGDRVLAIIAIFVIVFSKWDAR